ncbi:DNA polymerase [Paramuricea clavata]|uniref:DNA-directed DNA polymerase n=1 Tax=Paramuricea clavata TaxID=317549 RepID=A0A7D9J9P4_PARCT|nr:DNA polymerase [Paramuricea clavata]
MQDLRQQTLEKIQFLKDSRYNVVEIWTCDIERQLATEAEIKDFFENFEISEPLEPCHAFFGGRTNAVRLYHDIQPEEKIRYVDFCSLYPWCNKYGEYPIGHPEIITENFQPISEDFVLVKCSVLPPRALYHPILPYCTQGKLMFPLCRTCADNLQQELCHHSDAERTLYGMWVTLELEKALEKGYKLVKIDEVWHFPEHTDGLFKDYIDTFLKIKQEIDELRCFDNDTKPDLISLIETWLNDSVSEHHITIPGFNLLLKNRSSGVNGGVGLYVKSSIQFKALTDIYHPELEASGFPPERDTDEKKGQYIVDYAAKEGIQLDPRQIVNNPGLRALAKLMLNSCWATIQQLTSLTRTSSTTSSSNPLRKRRQICRGQRKANVVIAAFTTAHARLKLYGILEQLNRCVLYFKTDSVIYVLRDGEWEPRTGSYLGKLADELDGAHITTFVSGGPKNYAYEMNNDKTVCKVRGITLDYKTQQHVHFYVISDMVMGEGPEKVTVNMLYKITRETKEKSVKTRSEDEE